MTVKILKQNVVYFPGTGRYLVITKKMTESLLELGWIKQKGYAWEYEATKKLSLTVAI